MKKYGVYLLAGVLVATSLAGCGKEKPEEILQTTVKNAKETKSVAGDMEMEMEVDANQSGVSMGIELGVSGDWEAATNPTAFHFDGEAYFNMMNISMDVEMYGVEEDNTLNLYMKMADQWTHMEQPMEDIGEIQGEMDMKKISEDILKKMSMDEKTKKTKEKELYVFRTEITGEEINSWITDVEEIPKEQLEEAGVEDLKADVKLTIDKAKKLPAGFTMDFGESFQKIMDTAMEEAGATGEDVSVKINKCALEMDFHEYDTIEKIEVPEEALEAKNASGTDLLSGIGEEALEEESELLEEEGDTQAEELQETETDVMEMEDAESEEPDVQEEDEFKPEMPRQGENGAYILEDYEGAMEADIKAPEGFQDGYMDKHYITYSKELSDSAASMVSMAYNFQKFDEYYTEEDYIESFLAQEANAEEYGYKKLVCSEPKKIKAGTKEITCLNMDFSYEDTDKNRQITLWVPLKENYYLQCMVSENVLDGDYTMEGNEELVKLLFDGVTFEGEKVI